MSMQAKRVLRTLGRAIPLDGIIAIEGVSLDTAINCRTMNPKLVSPTSHGLKLKHNRC